jgi:putative hydrolase of the HAD superfamily
MQNVLFSSEERKMWKKLVQAEPNLANRLSELRKKVIYELLVENNVDSNEAKKLAEKSFEIFLDERHKVVYFDGVLSALEKLKDRYILGVITNGNADIKTLKIDHLFDFYVNAEMVNESKPGRKIFDEAVKLAGVLPEEICHIGDHPVNDVEGAVEAGMQAIWMNALEKDWEHKEALTVPEVKNWKELEERFLSL